MIKCRTGHNKNDDYVWIAVRRIDTVSPTRDGCSIVLSTGQGLEVWETPTDVISLIEQATNRD